MPGSPEQLSVSTQMSFPTPTSAGVTLQGPQRELAKHQLPVSPAPATDGLKGPTQKINIAINLSREGTGWVKTKPRLLINPLDYEHKA